MPSQVNLQTASQMFDPTVTVIAQNKKFLGNTVKERHGTTGDATNVPVSALIEMQDVGFAATDIPVTPVNNTNNLVVPFNYALKTVIGGGYRTLFAYDTIVDQMIDHGFSVGRNDDFIKINALFNSTNFNSIPVIPYTVGINTGLNQEKLTTALATMADAGWDVSNLQCSVWSPVLQKTPLFQDPTVNNWFTYAPRPLSNNQIQGYLDLDMRFLGSQGINAIPFTSAMGIDTYLVPMVHTNSMVQTYNRDPNSSVSWLNWQDRYELLSTMTSGANVIQYSGIVLMECQLPFTAQTPLEQEAKMMEARKKHGTDIMTAGEWMAQRQCSRPIVRRPIYKNDPNRRMEALNPAHAQ